MVPGIVTDLLLFLGVLWLFDGLALSPVLLSGAVRRLVRSWPTAYLAPNYLLGVTGFALSHLLWLLFPVALHGGSLERNVLAWVAGVTLLNVVLWWLAIAIALPVLGLWRPKAGDGYDGRIALTAGLFGYVVAAVIVGLAAVLVAFGLYYPG